MVASPPCIAIVDDDEAVGRALRRLLRSAGFEVTIYISGEEFLDALADASPDAVVLDLQMPVVDGFYVQKQLHDRRADLPVLILTGYSSVDAREAALSGGAVGYFTKPVDGERLIEALHKALQLGT